LSFKSIPREDVALGIEMAREDGELLRKNEISKLDKKFLLKKEGKSTHIDEEKDVELLLAYVKIGTMELFDGKVACELCA
jgi:hypothetical protein